MLEGQYWGTVYFHDTHTHGALADFQVGKNRDVMIGCNCSNKFKAAINRLLLDEINPLCSRSEKAQFIHLRALRDNRPVFFWIKLAVGVRGRIKRSLLTYARALKGYGPVIIG